MGDDEPARFCRQLHPRLVGALGLHCGDAATGEDLAQETLARVWLHWSSVSTMASPEGWAFRVGFNLANSWLRRRVTERRARAWLAGEASVAGHDVAAAVAVRAAVIALPPRQRAAVVLRYFADLPVAEVAAVMGCAEGTVKSLTSQAVGALRVRLDVAETERGWADV